MLSCLIRARLYMIYGVMSLCCLFSSFSDEFVVRRFSFGQFSLCLLKFGHRFALRVVASCNSAVDDRLVFSLQIFRQVGYKFLVRKLGANRSEFDGCFVVKYNLGFAFGFSSFDLFNGKPFTVRAVGRKDVTKFVLRNGKRTFVFTVIYKMYAIFSNNEFGGGYAGFKRSGFFNVFNVLDFFFHR